MYNLSLFSNICSTFRYCHDLTRNNRAIHDNVLDVKKVQRPLAACTKKTKASTKNLRHLYCLCAAAHALVSGKITSRDSLSKWFVIVSIFSSLA